MKFLEDKQMNAFCRLCALSLAFVLIPAAAADKPSPAQAAYQQEKARCQRGETNQDRATCLKEAGAAYDEARRGRTGTASTADLARNAAQRCDAQPAADREACLQRLQSPAQGSAQGGGVLRQTETAK
jgi:hypothetical protein